jgi:hypothetical protein
MKVNKIFALAAIVLACTFSQTVFAQDNGKTAKPKYKMALGVKFFPTAVTFKNFSRERNRAFELLADFQDGFRLTGLYEFHSDLNADGNLKWYLGLGGHGGYYDKDGEEGAMAGIDGVVGLDYKFKKLPLNVSLDWQPSLELITPGAEFQAGRGGIAVRFAF